MKAFLKNTMREGRKGEKALLCFLRTWMLAVAIVLGILSYFVYVSIPVLAPTKPMVMAAISVVQPVLIFCMLFVTFCKVDPHDLRLRRWHGWHLLIQAGGFVAPALVLVAFPRLEERVVIEAAMLCLVCPTATAAAVVTGKLGGDMAGLTTYTILVNLVVAVVVAAFVPLVNPHPGLDFISSFFLIMGKVFPMLICPFFAALVVRFVFPAFHRLVLGCRDLAFYMWAVSLALAVAVSTKSLVHTDASLANVAGIAGVSLLTCVLQFWAGRKIGRCYGRQVSAGQALGQKNTVFAIWAGYTFMDPVTSIAGGFYSIWHNVYNSWQIAQLEKNSLKQEKKDGAPV